MSRSVLASCRCSAPLLDLVRGTAVNLNLDFREVSSAEEIRSLRGMALSVVVMAAPAISESLLAAIKHAVSLGTVWLIVVLRDATSQDETRAMEAGAIRCLDSGQAMVVLGYLIRNLLKCVRSETDAVQTELHISGGVTLRVPEYVLTSADGEHHLTPITGRLLQCLAGRTHALKTQEDLKRLAWGTPDGATDHALHQQMRRLRKVLDECGISDRLKCLRGKGYVLMSTKTD